MIRVLIILFNVIVVGLLIYRLIAVMQAPPEKSKKQIVLITGILLLLLPVAILLRFVPFTILYFLIYPLGIGIFLYFTDAFRGSR